MKNLSFQIPVVRASGLALFGAFALSACNGKMTPVTEPAGPEASAPAATPPPAVTAEKAPAAFKARFSTTKGEFVVEVQRAWSPNGADRFYNLVKAGYFEDSALFRVVPGFMVQMGMSGEPRVLARWGAAPIPDDPPAGRSNTRGAVTFATSGPNSRTTQIFVNYGNNSNLDADGFTPFGMVVSGLEVVDAFYGGYGDFPDFGGRGPSPGRIAMEGNAYLRREFPQLDFVKTARLDP